MLYARASPYKKRKERKKETKIMNEQFSIVGMLRIRYPPVYQKEQW